MASQTKGPVSEVSAYIVPNMVQGVSQQSPQERRDTQCEEQLDCVNSPVNGCEARPGFDFLKRISGPDLSNAYCYEIFRGDAEHYLVVINGVAYGSPTPRKLHVYDLNTGNECAITFTANESYLAVSGAPKDGFVATSVEDTHFVANKQIAPTMDAGNVSAAKRNAALLFFKAGGYSITFQVAVSYAGKKYTWTYTTPDNSTSANAAYITTNNLAATFFRSFTGIPVVVDTSGDDVVAGFTGVGASSTGDDGTHGTVSAPDTLTGLGFTCSLNGNIILIERSDGAPFTVDTGDGVGDTYLHCIKDTVQSFDLLPVSCFTGLVVKVNGTDRQAADDYYVTFTGDLGTSGYWTETVAPGTPKSLLATNMPHVLFNSGVNTFEWKVAPWGTRVSGDGIDTAKDPSFVGKHIQDLFYDHGRLGILTEGSSVWSRARNPYVFFPDSAQTVLDTDPIDIVPGGGKTIALLRRMVQTQEASFLWAEKIQFRVTSGVNPFKQDTVEAPPSTAYEFAPKATPKAVAESLYFVSEPGDFAAVRDLAILDGKPVGAADVTQHIPRYVPKGVRWIAASDTLRLLLTNSETTPNQLYAYNYLITQQQRIQSAWNTWRLPTGCKVLWLSISLNFVYALVQRGTSEAVFLKMDLSVDLPDPVEGATYLTRVDMRTTEASCTFAYDDLANTTTITMPYRMEDVAGYDGTTKAPMFVVNRASSAKFVRGRSWPILSITDTTVVVRGDCRTEQLYIGYRISAERLMSEFYIKSQRGLIPTERLTVKDLVVSYAKTGYFRGEVFYRDQGDTKTYEMTGRVFGDTANVMGTYAISQGLFKVPVNAENTHHTVRLVNDSFLPSRWTSASVNFQATFLAKPSAYGQGA